MLSVLLASLVAMFAIATAVMLLLPKSLSAASLRRMLVEPLSRWMISRKPMHIVGMIVLILFCLAGPEVAAAMMFAGFDAAAMEVLLLVWLAAATGGFRNVWRTIRGTISKLAQAAALRVRRGSARTPRRAKIRKPGGKDDGSSEPAWPMRQADNQVFA